MNDCPNADVRDLLPDLLHARLDAETRARVEAHVAECADCAAELALLRQLRAGVRTPRVDVAAIVAAVPAYRAPARRSWVGWRAAAAITVLVAGASSVALIQRDISHEVGTNRTTIVAGVPAVVAPVAPTDIPEVALRAAETPSVSSPDSAAPARASASPLPVRAPEAAVRELAMGGGDLGDLDDRQLASLLKDIESLDAVPSVEVESTPVSPIAPSARAGP